MGTDISRFLEKTRSCLVFTLQGADTKGKLRFDLLEKVLKLFLCRSSIQARVARPHTAKPVGNRTVADKDISGI